jgi:mannose-6-phosphate isomerase-like protein (cupin superfamily)
MRRQGIVRAPGEGRLYPMGRLSAAFKADGEESNGRYSISEWWLDPDTLGPGAHSHPEDDVFYVIEGTVSFFMGDSWIDAPKGSFVLAPGGVPHDLKIAVRNGPDFSMSPSRATSRKTCRRSASGSARTDRHRLF